MKKQITIALLLIISAFAACKKDEGPQVDIEGTWNVSKVETTIAGSPAVIYTGTSSDNIEFRRNEQNEMVVHLNSVSAIGNYFVLVNDGIRFNYSGKTRAGQITTLTANKLEFSVTVEGVTPATTEKYYLSK